MKKVLSLFFVILIILSGIFVARFILNGGEDAWICVNNQWIKHGKPNASMPKTGCGPLLLGAVAVETPLGKVIKKSLEGTQGTYAVVVKNLKTQESYSLNEHRVFEPGSLYKLWVMAAAFKQIEKGELSEEEILSENIVTLNEKFKIPPEAAELTKGEMTLSVKVAIEQMITISHNYAAFLLTDKIGLPNIKTFLQENGFYESVTSTDNDPPKTTPYDIALFFEKLYQGKIANQESTTQMIDVLKRQKLNDQLPKYLPSGVVMAHKTGEIGHFSHDAGIVFSQKGDYIIVVLSESDFPPGAEERLAVLSKSVYEYFEK